MAIKFLPTWNGEKEQFAYSGSVKTGTAIAYGPKLSFKANISAEAYTSILREFAEQEVPVGTSQDNPSAGSVGEFVKANINRSGLMSYIGAILVSETFAEKPRRGWIRFFL
jgi:hypothetical protein